MMFYSCSSMKNPEKPELQNKTEGYFYKARDGSQLFIYEYQPGENYNSTIFIISGITGINHNSENDIITLLSNNENRIVIVHPRGTGYTDGIRGDISRFGLFIDDYKEIIMADRDYRSGLHPIFLFGHSMSTAVTLAVASELVNINGAILVNPPYLLKSAKGMTPGLGQYIKYACYMIFARHKPIVNMAGDPSVIENKEDKAESVQRVNDTLLVKYFSMYYMNESRKLIKSIPEYCREADYPLLLIYGLKDNIVDKKGCDLIYETWKNRDKKYILVENGSHGKSTVKLAGTDILEWMKDK